MRDTRLDPWGYSAPPGVDSRLRPDPRFWAEPARWEGPEFWPQFRVVCDHSGRLRPKGTHLLSDVGRFVTTGPVAPGEPAGWVPAYGQPRGRKGERFEEAFGAVTVFDDRGILIGKGIRTPEVRLVARTLDGDADLGWLPPAGWTWSVEMRCKCEMGQDFTQAKLVPVLNALRLQGLHQVPLYLLINALKRNADTQRRAHGN